MKFRWWRHEHKWRYMHPPFVDDQERCYYGPAICACGETKEEHWEAYD